jgi:hypothetical protein
MASGGSSGITGARDDTRISPRSASMTSVADLAQTIRSTALQAATALAGLLDLLRV